VTDAGLRRDETDDSGVSSGESADESTSRIYDKLPGPPLKRAPKIGTKILVEFQDRCYPGKDHTINSATPYGGLPA
jgi:hypothetical protein